MASARDFAVVSALVLALFLWLRPVVGRLGEPTPPDTRGHAASELPAGVSKGFSSMDDGPAPAAAPTLAGPVSHLEDVERRILDAANAERQERGLAALAPESTLRELARAHSDDMLRRGFFDHVNPDGASPSDRVFTTHRTLVGLTGENIWTGSGFDTSAGAQLADTIVESWMSSPGHRENILKPEYTHLGVGVSTAGAQIRATQSFAEVRAFTGEPVPAALDRGAKLAVRTISAAGSPAAKLDLWSSSRGLKVAGPFDVDGAPIDVPPATYQLRFYFPDGPGSYTIYYGPLVEVE
jgi:uncharacterized protein YkwD